MFSQEKRSSGASATARTDATLFEENDEDAELLQRIRCFQHDKCVSLYSHTSPRSLHVSHIPYSPICRKRITENMTSLDYPVSSSDEDGFTDDMASTGDEIDDEAMPPAKPDSAKPSGVQIKVESEWRN